MRPIKIGGFATSWGTPFNGWMLDRDSFGAGITAHVPMLVEHRWGEVIGSWTEFRIRGRGLWVEGHIKPTSRAARLAVHAIVAGLKRGLSVQFKSIHSSLTPAGYRKAHRAELLEVSVCANPAVASAQLMIL